MLHTLKPAKFEDIPRKLFTTENLIVPVLIGYYEAGKYIVELAQTPNTWSFSPIFAVTVYTRGKHGKGTDLSRPFSSLQDAVQYIHQLEEEADSNG